MSEPNLPPPDPTLHPSSMAREYRKGNWTLQETLILITAKKLDEERRLKATSSSSSPSSSNRNSGELRWKWVENYCWSHGCLRSQNQCNDKWDNLLRDYKKVREYEATKSSSSSSHVSNSNEFEFQSYWTMEKHQRKERKLPSNMLLQVYQAVTQVLQKKSLTSQHHHHQHHQHQHHHQQQQHVVNVVHPPPPQQQQHLSLLTSPSQSLSQTIPVASQPLLLTLPPPPHPPPPLDSTTPAVSEGSESSGTEYKQEEDNSESKRRKFEQKLGSSIMHSASELARALGSCEEKKEKRHEEMMELHQRRLHMEETRNQVNQQGITSLVSAVTNLTGAIQTLITSMNKDHGGRGGGNGDDDACSS